MTAIAPQAGARGGSSSSSSDAYKQCVRMQGCAVSARTGRELCGEGRVQRRRSAASAHGCRGASTWSHRVK